jgi:hypothetical protein
MAGRRRATGVFLAVAAAVLVASPASAFLGPWAVEMPADGRFPRMLADAEAVAAVTVTRVEPGRDGADEPTWVEGRVETAVKGPVAVGEALRFAESDWCGPARAWGEGQLRLLFLRRGEPAGPVRSPWWSMCPVTGKLDCHLDPREAADLSPAAIGGFLQLLSSARSQPPAFSASLRREGDDLIAEVAFVNGGPEPLWFDPARAQVMLVVGGMRRPGSLLVGDGGWTLLAPGASVTGTAAFAGAAAEDLSRGAVVTVANDAVLYPRRSWTGTLSSSVLRLAP